MIVSVVSRDISFDESVKYVLLTKYNRSLIYIILNLKF